MTAQETPSEVCPKCGQPKGVPHNKDCPVFLKNIEISKEEYNKKYKPIHDAQKRDIDEGLVPGDLEDQMAEAEQKTPSDQPVAGFEKKEKKIKSITEQIKDNLDRASTSLESYSQSVMKINEIVKKLPHNQQEEYDSLKARFLDIAHKVEAFNNEYEDRQGKPGGAVFSIIENQTSDGLADLSVELHKDIKNFIKLVTQ